MKEQNYWVFRFWVTVSCQEDLLPWLMFWPHLWFCGWVSSGLWAFPYSNLMKLGRASPHFPQHSSPGIFLFSEHSPKVPLSSTITMYLGSHSLSFHMSISLWMSCLVDSMILLLFSSTRSSWIYTTKGYVSWPSYSFQHCSLGELWGFRQSQMYPCQFSLPCLSMALFTLVFMLP